MRKAARGAAQTAFWALATIAGLVVLSLPEILVNLIFGPNA
jgi:hypothetical protein